jgi:chromosome partitioning protein
MVHPRRGAAAARAFRRKGPRQGSYRPYRPEGLPAKLVAVANFKGGVGKTSTAAHLAMSAALDGYRVLVIDLDSQGSHDLDLRGPGGGRMADGLSAARAALRPPPAGENQGAARGDALATLDDTLARRWTVRPGSDPADPLAQHRPDRRAAQSLLGGIPDPGLAHAGAGLEALGCADREPGRRRRARRYDLVFLDTPPALGYLTINGLAAADILLVPLGASFLEFDSTGASSTCCTPPSAPSRRRRTSPPARWGAGPSPSNGTRCAR